jgi:RHS repeat-associated protein
MQTSARRWAATGLALLMTAYALVAVSEAAPAETVRPVGPRDDLRLDRPVEVTPVEPAPSHPDQTADQVWASDRATARLPEPAAAVFPLGRGTATPAAGTLPVPDGFPVSVTAPAYRPGMPPVAPAAGRVSVATLDANAARAAGVAGLVLVLTATGSGPADLRVDYARFADRFGAGWATRLRLFELPPCALTTPRLPDCLRAVPVDAVNRVADGVVSARIHLDEPLPARTGPATDRTSAGGTRVFAVMAAPSSQSAGDYRATDLSPAGSWTAGANDGSFTYSYPLRVPPAAGPLPVVSLGYSSASHDGRTSGRNAQASWLGDGWGYEPGFIERSYRSCSGDDEGAANSPELTGDLCWDGDGANVTMSLNGTNTTLVRDDDTGEWRAAADPNWRIERLGSPASSGAATSERWKVTTTDGTQYLLAADAAANASRWTVPVFGNHPGEPCRQAQFRDSSCAQAWRWQLDRAVDVHGNVVRYVYATEAGHYGAAGDATNRVPYHRGGRLVRIEYGSRTDSGVAPTGRVLFTAGDRCLADCGSAANPNEQNWPDTPWDLNCAAAPCTSQLSPVFFTTKRLQAVTTQVRDGSGFRDVDSWALEHVFQDYGDADQAVLWLRSIRHTGHVGDAITLPEVRFGGEALPNRVDTAGGVPVMWRWRLSSIRTEAGGVVTITYADPECAAGNLPASPHSNAMRCYPVRWTPAFLHEPIEDWFHKHVVVSVVETDTTGGMPAVETYYDYATAGGGTSALWAWDDSEYTEDKHRTYNGWRGYPQVTTLVGDPAQPQTRTRSRFYRGLDGQPLPSGGERDVTLTDSEGNTATDHEALAGQVWETVTFDDVTVVSGSTHEFWTRRTATRARNHAGGSVDAWLTGESVSRTRTRLTGSQWQRTETRTTFDSQGRPVRIDDRGDVGTDGDDLCVRHEYVDNDTAWIRSTVARSETVAVDCATTPSRPRDVASDVRMFYDGSDVHGGSPGKGALTRVDALDGWGSGPVYVTTARVRYDPLGRIIESTDALGRTSTVGYTPAGPGPVTRKVSTNAVGHRSTAELEPAWGLPTASVDPNGRRTDVTYDALGRSSAVWLPGRDPATQPASLRFDYAVRDTVPSAVTTRTLNHRQEYITSIVLYDSLLRERQTQRETADRGRLVTEIRYDTQGRVEEESGPDHNVSPPDTTLVRVREEDSARRIDYAYDAAGRVVTEVFHNRHVERWRTTTGYGGSTAGFMVTVRPPEGAPATATITDARGNVVEKRTYRGNEPVGAFDRQRFEYSPDGRLERMTDPAGNEWTWQHDRHGRVTVVHDPDAGTSTMSYDAAGNLRSVTDARGETLGYDYDEIGRMTSRRDGAGTLLAEWAYDTAIGGVGMLGTSTRWVDGEAYRNEVVAVNGMGLVTQTAVTLPASAGPLAGRHFFTQNYHPNGQVGAQGLPAVGGLERATLASSYDHVGNPTRLVHQGQFTGVTVVVDEAAFTPHNEILTRRLGAGNARHAYHGFVYEEGTRRLQRATFDREASVHSVADLRYSYDDAGNVRSIADVPEDLPANHELQCFRYDHLRRLVEAWAQGGTAQCAAAPGTGVLGGPAPYWNSYDHDITGNRTAETVRVPGQPARSRTYAYPAAGQERPHAVRRITTAGSGEQVTFGYDDAGNTVSRDTDGAVQALRWDAEGRVEAVEQDGATVRMVHDANGDRLLRDDGDSVTAYLPQTELTWYRASGTVTGTRYFTHAGHVVATSTGRDVADWTFLGVDRHGSTTTHAVNAFTAVAQVRRLDPYGNPRGTAPPAWPGQRTFAGGVGDPTGLVHLGARSYDPATGRFLSVDPLLAVGDDQQINGYSYANNNPMVFSDPTGLCFWDGINLCPGYDVRKQPTRPPPTTASPAWNGPQRRGGNGSQCPPYGNAVCGLGARRDYEQEALEHFFGPPPPGHEREVIQTDATAPGNGVIVSRFFISDEGFYWFGMGDGRGFSTEVEAGYRVVVAWDTDTGRVSFTAAPSCASIGHPETGTCLSPHPIGEGNDIEVVRSGEGHLSVEFSAPSSVRIFPAIDQQLTISVGQTAVGVRIKGDPYPDFEAVAYRGGDVVMLAQSPHAVPGGPAVHLAPGPERDVAWLDGYPVWIGGQSIPSGLKPSGICGSNPLALGC